MNVNLEVPSERRLTRILVVEDYPAVRVLLMEILREAGYDVVEAETATSAIAILTQSCCAAVISDVLLPGGSGFDVADHARRNNVPVLLCTGDLQAAVRLERAGVYHLRKPFMLDAMMEWIEEQLHTRRETGFCGPFQLHQHDHATAPGHAL